MAIVNVKYDTKTKKMVADKDGEAIANCSHLSFSKSCNTSYISRADDEETEAGKEDKFQMMIHRHVKDKDHDTHEHHSTYASLQEDGVDVEVKGEEEAEVLKTTAAIHEFFGITPKK